LWGALPSEAGKQSPPLHVVVPASRHCRDKVQAIGRKAKKSGKNEEKDTIFCGQRIYESVLFSLFFWAVKKKAQLKKRVQKTNGPIFFVFYFFSKRKKASVNTFLYQRKKSVHLFCSVSIVIAFETVKRKKYPFIFCEYFLYYPK
jgi:hypothetical protein